MDFIKNILNSLMLPYRRWKYKRDQAAKQKKQQGKDPYIYK